MLRARICRRSSSTRCDDVKRAALAVIMTIVFAAAAASAFEPSMRVRIGEHAASPQATLAMMSFSDSIASVAGAPPAWSELRGEADVADHDMVITFDDDFVRRMTDSGAIVRAVPIFAERAVIVGPAGTKRGEPASVAAAALASGRPWFSSRTDRAMMRAEAELFSAAKIDDPTAYSSFIESDAEGVDLLFQTEDEEGFAIVGVGALAQYISASRGGAVLGAVADLGAVRTAYVCLTYASSLRARRADAVRAAFEWLVGGAASEAAASFELGGMHPFVAR